MLSDRERRTLATIEQQLAASDPEFVRIFRTPVRRPTADALPRILLVLGLALMVLGSAAVAVPVAVLGVALSLGALALAAHRTGGAGLAPA